MDKDIYRRAVSVWGNTAQIDMALEEMGELTVAIQQWKRGRVTSAAIQEEVADVSIMMRQLSVMFGEDDILSYEKHKLSRLEMRVGTAEKEAAQSYLDGDRQ